MADLTGLDLDTLLLRAYIAALRTGSAEPLRDARLMVREAVERAQAAR